MFKISDVHPSEGKVYVNHLLGISFANSKEDLFNCNVAGFVCVTDVDTKSKIVTILSPQPELPADCLFVVSDIQYNYQKSVILWMVIGLNKKQNCNATRKSYFFFMKIYLGLNKIVVNCCLPLSFHILVTSFFVFWLFRMTKIFFHVCLLTHFARQDRQNGNLESKQNHATKVTKI